MLNDIASNTSFFGIFITGVAYVLACAIQKRFKSSILNPLLVSCVILIIFMLVSGIDYNVYLYGKPKADGTYDGTGAIFFQNMLTPTTVCLAIPLYEKLVYLKKYPVAIIGGILAGMFACLGGVLVLSMAFGLDHTQYVTLLPKSITTAIGMGRPPSSSCSASSTRSPSACPAAPVRTPWAPPVRVSSARLKKP